MKYFKTLLLLVAFFAISQLHAQTLSNKVVASGGSYSTAAWGSLSATIGETTIATLSSPTTKLLQGFQQPSSGLTGIVVNDQKAITNLYPNPANKEVVLEIQLPNTSEISYKAIDMTGKVVASGNFTADAMHNTQEKIGIENWDNGMYLFYLYSGSTIIGNIKLQVIR